MRTNYQSLSLFRILLAVYLGVEFFAFMLPWYTDFYTDQGMLPRADLLKYYQGRWVPTLLLLSDHPLLHATLIDVFLLALLAFGIGYRTRLATLALLVTYTSFYWRNYLPISGAEMLVRLFLLWSLFLPLGRYWSVDAALDSAPPDRPYPKLPLYSIRVQIGMIYLVSALFKIAGAPWRDGSAIQQALSGNIFGGTVSGLWLVHHCAFILPFLTWGTIAFQFAFTPLVYCPWRNRLTRSLALAGAAAMHISFMFLLNVGMFPFLCLTYLLVLIPDEWWNGWLRQRRSRLEKVRLYYDPGCRFCEKTALLFRSFCLVPASQVVPADAEPAVLAVLRAHHSWVVYTSDGQEVLHWRAVAYVLRQSPVFAPLGWLTDLPCLRSAMRRLYRWIGDHRPAFGRLTAFFLPFRPQPVPGLFLQGACLALLIIAVTDNFYTLPRPDFESPSLQAMVKFLPAKEPRWLFTTAAWTQTQQEWGLFAPHPIHVEQRWVLQGTQADRTTVDLVTRLHPVPFTIAANNYRIDFSSHGVLKYFSRINPLIGKNADTLAKYICRKVNFDATPSTYITNWKITYYSGPALSQQEFDKTIPHISRNFSCVPLNKKSGAGLD